MALGHQLLKITDVGCSFGSTNTHAIRASTFFRVYPARFRGISTQNAVRQCESPAVLLEQAFTRTAQLEPENGEAWNNIAAIHMQAGRHAPSAVLATALSCVAQ